MYESFYGFNEKPFSLLPDPAFLFLSEKHRLALTMLQYGIMNQAGFTVVTGEIGSGKTTLIRQVLNEVGEDVAIGVVSNTHRNFGELMQWVLLAFGLEHRDKKRIELYQT
ncbi:MAG: ExeA family protein, partial [Sulfurifustis sp.]